MQTDTLTLFDEPAPAAPQAPPRPFEGETLTVVLVSCGKTKTDTAAPARDLYTGDLFRKSRAYAERVGDRWYVLSAKHRLVHPDKVLEPYEQRMGGPLADRQHWARIVEGDLRLQTPVLGEDLYDASSSRDRARVPLGTWKMGGGRVQVVLLAGVDYREHLVPLLESWADQVEAPMEGLSFGEQKAWLIAHTPA